MAFKSNRELEGTNVGAQIQLTSPLRVLAGEYLVGSILEVIEEPDERGEFICRDLDSGNRVGVHPAFTNFRRVA